MLQKLNEGIKGWVSTVIIVLISLSFVIFGISYYVGSRSGSSAVIAKVGSASITNRQLQFALRQEQFSREKTQGALTKSELAFLQSAVLDALIQQEMGFQALDKLGLTVPQTVIEQTIESLPSLQMNGQYDPQLLKIQLSRSGLTLPQLIDQISDRLRMQQLTVGISLSTFVFPQSILALYNWADQTRDFRYVMIDAANFSAGLNVSDKDLNAYYEAHQAQYALPDRVLIDYIDLNPQEIIKGISVPPVEVRKYYDANQDQFRLPATYRYASVVVLKPASKQEVIKRQKEVNAIDAALKMGRTLQNIAAQFGGSVQSTPLDKLNPVVLGFLQTMQPGQLLAQQEIDAGSVWLELLSVKPGAIKPFSAVQESIKSMLLSQKMSAKMASMTETLSDQSYTQSSSLEPVAKALGIRVIQSPWVSKTGTTSGLFSDKKLINEAFSDEVLKQGNNSMPITLSNGSVVVLRIKEFKKAQVRPLKEVGSDVLKKVTLEAGQLQAALFAAKLQQALQQNQPVSAMMASHHLSWKQVVGVKRADNRVPAKILKAAFSDPKAPAVLTSVDGNSTSVIQVQSIHLPKASGDQQKREQRLEMIRSFYANLDLAALITSVQNTIPVKRYPERAS